MKRKITSEELEEICSQKFNIINDTKAKIKELKYILVDLCIKKNILKNKYKQLKIEYNKILDAQAGKGEYYKIILRPIEIKERLTTLEDSIYDNYKRCINKKKEKEFQLLRNVLEEDLKNANIELKNFEENSLVIEKNYNEIAKKYKECKKQIGSIQNEIRILEQLQNKLLIQIKNLNCAYESDKKVNVKKMIKPK